MRRAIALSLLIVALAPGTWLRVNPPPPGHAPVMRYVPLPLPPRREIAGQLGAFALAGAWRMESGNRAFNSFSALLRAPDGSFTGFTDRGWRFRFAAPSGPPGRSLPIAIARSRPDVRTRKPADSESATASPDGQTVWIGWEGENAISRHDASGRETGRVRPAAMQDWGNNQGPEAMVRLADGRFVVLAEGYTGWLGSTDHPAVLFAGDPVDHRHADRFTFAGPVGFRPTDMAQMPDGRVLILMRKVVWPVPARFVARLVLADPAMIRPGKAWRGEVVARIGSMLPLDNFEGLAVHARGDRRLDIWLVSDSNQAALQKDVLWRLIVDPARLAARSRK